MIRSFAGDKTSVSLNMKNVTAEDDTWTYSCVGFHASDFKQIYRLGFTLIVMYSESKMSYFIAS